ncbi:hypothetical protein [Cognatiluteimonas profundi]|uniref:hypothetical protein n=1 Tax=Cognatiluteimonas profundi TaxID=2594501 RepID=UPI00131CD6A5|nr:hypothetical protein [Lysobacter profundi]
MSHAITHGAQAELWQALVHEAGARARTPLDDTRESYLVFVLLRYQRDDTLLARTQALEWLEAQARVGSIRTDALRDVGDRCLLIAGLFPQLAVRRHVQGDYFINLGRGAYFEVAQASRNAYATLFEQLAYSYQDLVRTLRALRRAPELTLPAWPAPVH